MSHSDTHQQQLCDTEFSIQQWKTRKMIQMLSEAKGDGTSMISLIIPPKSQISHFQTLLREEYGTAASIKSRVNRQSVQDAIVSTQQRLKDYDRCPPNGLCIYCGTIETERGTKRIAIDFEPFKPISAKLYHCDSKFDTEPLQCLLECDDKFGFIIMNGNGVLFGTLQGNTRTVLTRFRVDLPRKHCRGGQSSVRFSKIREEKRHNYLRRVTEVAVQCFITNDKVNVAGLILGGSAEFKTELSQSSMFDPRLSSRVLRIVDVSYGGVNGFNQAIDLSADTLGNVKFVKEKQLLQDYFAEIGQDTGKYVFGVADTIRVLEMGAGAVSDLIVWEDLPVKRYELRHPATGEKVVKHLTVQQERDPTNFVMDGVELAVEDSEPLSDWLVLNHTHFGCTLHTVTDRSQEGSQFCRGFGGIGGLLRFNVDVGRLNEQLGVCEEDEDESSFLSSGEYFVESEDEDAFDAESMYF